MTKPIASLILTRPNQACARFLQQLGPVADRCAVFTSPLLEIVPTGQNPDLEGVAGVIFTSSNGVKFAGVEARGIAYCVGARTTDVARARGWDAHHVADGSQDLIAALKDAKPPAPLLHIGGVHRRGDVAARLIAAGIETREVDVYDQKLLDLSEDAKIALRGDKPTIVPLFSPRTAGQFANQAKGCKPLHFVAISDAVLGEVGSLSAASHVVSHIPRAESVAEEVVKVIRRVEAKLAPK